MEWHDYDVTIYDGSNPPRSVVVRAFTRMDAEWVATHPCQRNNYKPVAEERDGLIIRRIDK